LIKTVVVVVVGECTQGARRGSALRLTPIAA
jgi:hypothetical protein